jgi:hypothetical protein
MSKPSFFYTYIVLSGIPWTLLTWVIYVLLQYRAILIKTIDMLRIPDLILKLNVFTRLIGVISLYQKVDFYAKNNDNNKYFPIICTPWA